MNLRLGDFHEMEWEELLLPPLYAKRLILEKIEKSELELPSGKDFNMVATRKSEYPEMLHQR